MHPRQRRRSSSITEVTVRIINPTNDYITDIKVPAKTIIKDEQQQYYIMLRNNEKLSLTQTTECYEANLNDKQKRQIPYIVQYIKESIANVSYR